MPTTGLEVRLTEGRERAEVARFTKTLDEIVRSLREIDRVYLRKGTRATWVLADLKHDHEELIVRLEARPRSSERTVEDMLRPVDALVIGAERLGEVAEVPEFFLPQTVGRLGELATPKEGVQAVALAPYNGVVGRAVYLTDAVQRNALEAVSPFEMSYGSVTGVVEVLGTARKNNLRLNIYESGNRRPIQAYVAAAEAEQVRQLWLHRVLVGGIIKRNRRGQVIRIDVDQVMPLPETDDARPSTDEVLGIDPGWLGAKTVDEYLREVRGEG
ncbi:hypothetical protein [Paracoccus sp. (in: a-proteobacteria)]|uniref:hypothetical protein n=1 Tax=Paracoccus sp. TaxID=267 RepID=UPI0032209A91